MYFMLHVTLNNVLSPDELLYKAVEKHCFATTHSKCQIIEVCVECDFAWCE